jgi:hypothetical protein
LVDKSLIKVAKSYEDLDVPIRFRGMFFPLDDSIDSVRIYLDSF